MTTSALQEQDRLINQLEQLLTKCEARLRRLNAVEDDERIIRDLHERVSLRIRVWQLTMGLEALRSLPPQNRSIGVLIE